MESPSSQNTEVLPGVAEINWLFSGAEEAVKVAENIRGDVPIPAINQLRYAARHLLNGLKPGLEESRRREQFARAERHCKRAIYDATETAVTFYIERILAFQEDNRGLHIAAVWPTYVEEMANADDIRAGITALKRGEDDADDPTDSRVGYFEKIGEHRDQLQRIHRVMRQAEQALLGMRQREEEKEAERKRLEEEKEAERKRLEEARVRKAHVVNLLIAVFSSVFSGVFSVAATYFLMR